MRDDDVKVEVIELRGGARLRVRVGGESLVNACWVGDTWWAGYPGYALSGAGECGESAARDWLRRVGEACIEASKVEVPRE